ncbi:site-specific tyrosine recombinase XerC [Photorhabdus thracensis]|uniref:site-specific tyrosine recombinase XerC n=1 Tax=Photorhabdus thracensis TaxID=230089 RepID=UPI002B4B9E7D|nr:site-specific tyrosine recombinase XerC [Photorhabdus thracensis]
MTFSHNPALITLRQHLEIYLDSLTARHYSARTREAYRERLLPFIDWCEARSVNHTPQVSLPLLESWQRYLRSYRRANRQSLSLGSQLSRLSALRTWFRWLLQRSHILYNPADQMILPKEDKRLPSQVLNREETEQILAGMDSSTLNGLRNRAMLELFWSTGIRRKELANLLPGDVDFGRGVVNVRLGKGRKDRVVPVGARALDWLTRYLTDVRPRLATKHDSGYLFIGSTGKGLELGTVTGIARDAVRQSPYLNKSGACHLFRHSMATQMLENGADTRHIQAILGHEKLETTQIYTRVAIGHLKKVHEQTHPAERQSKQATPDDKQVDSDKPDSPKPV